MSVDAAPSTKLVHVSMELSKLIVRYGSVQHDGERFQLHLCEDCLVQALANLRQEHRLQNVVSEDYQTVDPDAFWRVEGNIGFI